jgi:hypothetical protein
MAMKTIEQLEADGKTPYEMVGYYHGWARKLAAQLADRDDLPEPKDLAGAAEMYVEKHVRIGTPVGPAYLRSAFMSGVRVALKRAKE